MDAYYRVKTQYLAHFGLGNLSSKYAANTTTTGVHTEHDLYGFLTPFAEKLLQNENYEFHRSVIVVNQDNAVQRRLF